MISNPVVVKQGGGGQVYTITDNSGSGFPASAEAGAFVYSEMPMVLINGIYTLDGSSVPWASQAIPLEVTYFVMPASDVTIC